MAYDRRSAKFRSAAELMAVAATAIGVLVLVGGWAVGVDALKSLVGTVGMKANAAAGIVLCGVSLFLLTDPERPFRRGARVLAGVAGAIGLVTLLEYAIGHRLGIDELLFRDTTPEGRDFSAGRMAPQAAIALVLTAAALLDLDRQRRTLWLPGMAAGIVAAVSGAVLLGHVYDFSSLHTVRPFTGMVAAAATAFLLLALGIWCARPDRGVIAAVSADTTPGVMLRFLLPPAFVVPLVVGTLVMFGQQHGLYGDGEGIAMLIVATVFGCITFAIAAASTLQRLDGERRRSDERLLDQTRRYRTLVERLPLITYADELDSRNTPIYVSPQIETALGFTPEEWIGDPALFERLLHPDDRARVLDGIARFRATGGPFSCEYRLRTKSGSYAWVHDESMQVFDGTRGKRYAQGYILDITERKLADQETRALEQQLNQAQKLESIGQVAGGVAHDFNNVLGAILAYAGFAEEKARFHPEILEELAQIRAAAERAAELTQALLVFGRRDMVRPRVIDVNEAVTEARPLLNPLLGDRHVLRTALAPEPVCVEADPSQLQRLLMNLVLNARAAMPGGGTVDVAVATSMLDSPPVGLAPGSYASLVVSDAGVGMPTEVAARAFEPFFTTKEKGEGTGLGLSIVYSVVKRLGGHVEVDSKPGIGTTVTLLLPTVEAAPDHGDEERAGEAEEGNGEVVLVVDDDERLRHSTARILSAGGYSVLEAGDGLDALAQLHGHSEPPAVIVTDVSMPRMTGIELAAEVSGLGSGSRVVLMSGYADELEQAPDDIPLLAKPFSAEVLLRAVAEALSPQGVRR